MVNYIPTKETTPFREKRRTHCLKIQVDKAQNLFVKELNGCDVNRKRTTKSKSRQEDFYEIKDKARRKENKVELRSTWNVWEARLLSFTKSPN
jgi:hypothetical protein